MDESDQIVEWYESQAHRGRCERPTHAGSYRNSCGDIVRFELEIDHCSDRINLVRYVASGCMLSQSGAAALAEFLDGRKFDEAEQFSPLGMKALAGIALSPRRWGCWLAPWHAIQMAIHSPLPAGLEAAR